MLYVTVNKYLALEVSATSGPPNNNNAVHGGQDSGGRTDEGGGGGGQLVFLESDTAILSLTFLYISLSPSPLGASIFPHVQLGPGIWYTGPGPRPRAPQVLAPCAGHILWAQGLSLCIPVYGQAARRQWGSGLCQGGEGLDGVQDRGHWICLAAQLYCGRSSRTKHNWFSKGLIYSIMCSRHENNMQIKPFWRGKHYTGQASRALGEQ
jgi:hypothetical protein